MRMLVFLLALFLIVWHAKCFALSVAPSVVEVRIPPGQRYTSSFKIVNDTEEEKEIDIEFSRWAHSAVTYPDERSFRWISVEPKRLTLSPGQSGEIRYTLTMPRDGKDEKMAMAFVGEVPKEAMGISARTRVGVPIYVSAKSHEVVRGELSKLVVKAVSDNHGKFNVLKVTPHFKNDGNVHVRPHMSMMLRDSLGEVVKDDKGRDTFIIADAWPVFPHTSKQFDEQRLALSLVPEERYTAICTIRFGEFFELTRTQKKVINFLIHSSGEVEIEAF